MKQKYYVVWHGRTPGIYSSWQQCKAEVEGVAGARYKSFPTKEEATLAFASTPPPIQPRGTAPSNGQHPSALYVDANGMTAIREGVLHPPVLDAIAVDAACSGNPGVMEYQGVYIPTRTVLFHYRAELGTNNVGEFLAIVHGLSFLKRKGLNQVLYSDSVNAMSWVRQKRCKSKLPLTDATAPLWDYVHRAEQWLHSNTYTTDIRKWDTDAWGEIPADFGRKH